LDFADIERHRFRDLENEALRETRASVAPEPSLKVRFNRNA
jgi:hypothetical protein